MRERQEMCAGTGRRVCLPAYGGRERALEIYLSLDQSMVAAPHHPRERGLLLDKIAICYRELGAPPRSPSCHHLQEHTERHTSGDRL